MSSANLQEISGFESSIPVLKLTLDYKDENCLMDLKMLHALEEAANSIEDNYKACHLIIESSKDNFCQGLDLEHFWTSSVPDTHEFHRFEKILRRIEKIKGLTVALINGKCFGSGLNLALSCDIRISLDTALFAFDELSYGYIPGLGLWRLPKFVGLGRARELVLNKETISGQKALDLGLISKVCQNCQGNVLQKEAINYINNQKNLSIEALSSAKRLLNEAYYPNYENALGNYLACQDMCLKAKHK